MRNFGMGPGFIPMAFLISIGIVTCPFTESLLIWMTVILSILYSKDIKRKELCKVDI